MPLLQQRLRIDVDVDIHVLVAEGGGAGDQGAEGLAEAEDAAAADDQVVAVLVAHLGDGGPAWGRTARRPVRAGA